MEKNRENMGFFRENKSNKQENRSMIIGGHEVTLQNQEVITDEKRDNADELKQLVKDIANSPKLIVRSPEGEAITGVKFDNWRKEVADELIKTGQGEVFDALSQNYFSRAKQLIGVINILKANYPQANEWEKRCNEITGGLKSREYNLMSVGEKEKIGKKLDGLMKDIYSAL